LECIVHAVTGRPEVSEEFNLPGNTSFRFGDENQSLRSRAFVAGSLGIDPARIVFLKQVHGSQVISIESIPPEGRIGCLAEADGMATSLGAVALGILVADCVPVFIVDPSTPAIALVHAGWRGTAAQIAKNAIEVMRNNYRTKVDRCLAWIGPSIGPCCFEVGPEVTAEFEKAFERPFASHIDLREVNKQILMREGLPEDAIDVFEGCTCCGEGFFSHRRATHAGLERTGRMLAVMALRSG